MLVIEEGEDHPIVEDSQLPYKLIGNLGHGHSANVEKVVDVNTGSVFARKLFRICGPHGERQRIFDNEIKIIRRLAPHHHVIRVFATYTTKRELGLILHPVADCGDLETFLQDFREAKADQRVEPEKAKILETSFGCLASGLAFMHEQKVRHKDIKPRNILIHKGSVIYTDFGYSLDYSGVGQSTTTGRPNALTQKYCAPEVSDWGDRNRKSDVFSLGCVFLEILFVLYEGLVHPAPGESFHHSLENSQLRSLLNGLNPLGMITSDMLHSKPEDRSSAEVVVSKLRGSEANRFCATCKAVMSSKDEEMPDAPASPSFADLPPSRSQAPINVNSTDSIVRVYNDPPRNPLRIRHSSGDPSHTSFSQTNLDHATYRESRQLDTESAAPGQVSRYFIPHHHRVISYNRSGRSGVFV